MITIKCDPDTGKPHELTYLRTVRESTEVFALRFWAMQAAPVVASCTITTPFTLRSAERAYGSRWKVEGPRQRCKGLMNNL